MYLLKNQVHIPATIHFGRESRFRHHLAVGSDGVPFAAVPTVACHVRFRAFIGAILALHLRGERGQHSPVRVDHRLFLPFAFYSRDERFRARVFPRLVAEARVKK